MDTESAARQIDRDIRHEVLMTGKRPRDAFTDMITSLPKKFKSPELHKKVVAKIPSFNKVQPQLARLRAEGYASRLYMADPFGILAAIGGLEEIEKCSRRNVETFHTGEPGNALVMLCTVWVLFRFNILMRHEYIVLVTRQCLLKTSKLPSEI